jgi:hypothetical protein
LDSELDEVRFYQKSLNADEISYLADIYSEETGLLHRDSIAVTTRKIDDILVKLMPDASPLLSTITLTLNNVFTALRADGTGGTAPSPNAVVDDTNPATAVTAEFHDGSTGTLTAYMSPTPGAAAVSVGAIVLTSGDDSGTNSALVIDTDADPYNGTMGQEGFWQSLTSHITNTAGPYTADQTDSNVYIMNLGHSVTGTTANLQFYVEDDQAVQVPAVASASISAVSAHDASTYGSGVPLLTTSEQLTAQFTPTNCVRQFYNDTWIGQISDATNSVVTTTNRVAPGVFTADNDTAVTQACNIAAGAYTETATVDIVVRNAGGTTATDLNNAHATYTNLRIDTVSIAADEANSRVYSGAGQYPAFDDAVGGHLPAGTQGYGEAFTTSESLATVGVFELQIVNGSYRFPASIDYSGATYFPVGPNYTGLSDDGAPVGGYRWLTVPFAGLCSTTSNVELTFTASGLTAVIEPANFILQVCVYSGGQVTGWLDGNASYPGVGSPSANGDPALVYADSSSTVKTITFGTIPRTGDLYVRIGLDGTLGATITSITAIADP